METYGTYFPSLLIGGIAYKYNAPQFIKRLWAFFNTEKIKEYKSLIVSFLYSTFL